MQSYIIFIHNLLRWVLLVYLILIIYLTYKNQLVEKTSATLIKASKRLLIATHLSFVLGIYLLILRFDTISTSMKAVMSNKSLRFLFIEHPIGMLVSVALITIGHIKVKKNKIKLAHKLFIIALIIILACIPWPFRQEIGRPLFPQL